MKRVLVFLGIVLFSNLSCLNAASILVYEDGLLGTSAVGGALSRLGLSATTAADQEDFNAQLTSGELWDLVIFAEQHAFVFGGSQTQLTSYVNSGGKLMATTYKSSGLSSLMQASSVDINGREIVPEEHDLFAGFSSPIELSNPGWVTFSRSWDPAASGAFGYGTLGEGHAAILGHGGRTLLYGPLTDTFSDITEGERLLANGIQFLLIPEPATISLLALSGLLLCRRRK